MRTKYNTEELPQPVGSCLEATYLRFCRSTKR